MRPRHFFIMTFACVLLAAPALADNPSIELEIHKFLNPYLDEIRWWPTVSVCVPGASSVHLDVLGKLPGTAMTDEGDGDWSWEPTPPPWSLALDDPAEGLNQLYAGFWTVTINKDHPTDESVYTFTLDPLHNIDWASAPELIQPVQDGELPENYYFRWGFREGVFLPAGTHVSLSVEHFLTGHEVEVNSDWGTMDLYATAYQFAPGELPLGESMARVQYSRYEENRIVGFGLHSGTPIPWENGGPTLKLQAGQNLSFQVVPTYVGNGGFTPSNPADPTNPADPNEPFTGWTMFGPSQSVTAVEDPYDLPGNYVPQFTAWSPGGLTQSIDTPTEPFCVVLDYVWTVINEGATFTIYIDSQAIGALACPDVPDPDWHSWMLRVDPSLCALESVDLMLAIDGPTSSRILIDNIQFSNVPAPVPGDADNDGDVDGTDLAKVGLNWDPAGIAAPHPWSDANFDGDNDVDGTDLAQVGLYWNPAGTSVPEPATLSLLAIGGLAMLRRRERQYSM